MATSARHKRGSAFAPRSVPMTRPSGSYLLASMTANDGAAGFRTGGTCSFKHHCPASSFDPAAGHWPAAESAR